MIFPVVLSFDKEIAFGYCIHIKRRRRGNNGGGKKSIFPLVGYTAVTIHKHIYIYIFIHNIYFNCICVRVRESEEKNYIIVILLEKHRFKVGRHISALYRK